MNEYKISFGTSCMGRLHHIKKTYLRNIKVALDTYDNCEFVLLNWNSRDGLDDWVKENLTEYIESGIVKYIHTTIPLKFSQAITKNITCKNASGDIVCVLDGDNRLKPKFISKIVEEFNCHEFPIFGSHGAGVAGRMVCFKEHFLKIRGFDESLTKWGYEDCDFINRFKVYFDKHKYFNIKSLAGSAIHHQGRPVNAKNNKKISKKNESIGLSIVNTEEWGVIPREEDEGSLNKLIKQRKIIDLKIEEEECRQEAKRHMALAELCKENLLNIL